MVWAPKRAEDTLQGLPGFLRCFVARSIDWYSLQCLCLVANQSCGCEWTAVPSTDSDRSWLRVRERVTSDRADEARTRTGHQRTRRTAEAKRVSNLELQTATRLSVLCRGTSLRMSNVRHLSRRQRAERQLCQHIRASLPEPWMPTCLVAITVDAYLSYRHLRDEGAEAVPFPQTPQCHDGEDRIHPQAMDDRRPSAGGRVAQSR